MGETGSAMFCQGERAEKRRLPIEMTLYKIPATTRPGGAGNEELRRSESWESESMEISNNRKPGNAKRVSSKRTNRNTDLRGSISAHSRVRKTLRDRVG